MFKVKNKQVIHRIALRGLRANRLRNRIAVCAIALTAILFTTLFTIGFSINEAFQQANFRQAGGYSHGGFKYLTEQQFGELKDDPLIRESGMRRFVGMPSEAPFQKSHVEVGYADANQAKWMYMDPVDGDFPQEGTREAATDTRVLSLLGVEPAVGNEFTMTFNVDGTETTETFILSGFWEYDEAIVANHVLIPESRVEEIFTKLGTTGKDGMTGRWNLDVMFANAMKIERDVAAVLANHGYQTTDQTEPNYISTGVNWGYSGAQFSASADPITVVGLVEVLLLITFTGYLIIYNVFQISVARDIRFYGLLKTIGTTPKQLRRIIRQQAVLLSAIGIPLGLLVGYFLGVVLSPIVMAQLNGVVPGARSASPLIFVGSGLFALLTVLLSCAKPGRIAAGVSPVEAVRYAEGTAGKKKTRKSKKGVSLPGMALANLGRSKGKTVVTVVSLSLAVLLLNLTVTFTNGFDMDKYLRNVVTDFTVSEAGYFQVSQHWGSEAVDEGTIAMLEGQSGITGSGRTYGKVTPALQFVPEDWYRKTYEKYSSPEEVTRRMERSDRLPDGKLSDEVQLYGMEDFVLGKLKVFEGDAEKLKDPSGRYIAAVYFADDYDKLLPDSHWAKLGDTVTIRYIDKQEYYNPETGEVYENAIPEDAAWDVRSPVYHDVEYEVAALVLLPHNLGYRFYSADEYILGAERFVQDTGTETTMYYTMDTTDEAAPRMEKLLADYTQNEGAQYDYESKETYRQEFDSFRNMFLMMGGVLSGIIGMVGILNFLNAMLTGMITRRKEFAMLQSIGMTGRQLKTMLIWESLYYTVGSVLLCLLLSVAAAPLMASGMESVFWFFSYRFTALPILLCVPLMLLIAFAVPSLGYRSLAKQSVVERLRDAE